MPSSQVTFPNKATGQKLYATEVNAIKAAINANGAGLDVALAALGQKVSAAQVANILATVLASYAAQAYVDARVPEVPAGLYGNDLALRVSAGGAKSWVLAGSGTAPISTFQFLAIGDSMSTSYPQSNVLDSDSYPTFVQAGLNSAVWKTGTALGQGYPSMTAEWIEANGLPYVLSLKRTDVTAVLLFIWAGINNLRTGQTVAQAYAALKSLCLAAQAGGVVPVVLTTTINRFAGDPNTDALQADFNNLIVAGLADLHIPFAVGLHTDDRLNTADPAIQQDGLHLTIAGRHIVADMAIEGAQRYAAGERNFIVTGQSASNTTPAAPTYEADDSADTLKFVHALGASQLVVSIDNAAYIPYASVPGYNSATDKIYIGNVAVLSNYYRCKVKAAAGRNESPLCYSPSFAVAGTAPAVGPQLPALNWLARFSGDTGVTNQVSGGNDLVQHNAALTPNQYTNRAAWVLGTPNDDYLSVDIVNPTAQHWLVAAVVTPTGFAADSAAVLGGNNTSQALYWILRHNANPHYGQAAEVVGPTATSITPIAVVFYTGSDGNERMWRNGTVYVGDPATPVIASTHAMELGKYPGGSAFGFSGKYAALAVAGGTFSDSDAAAVGTALRTYYGI